VVFELAATLPWLAPGSVVALVVSVLASGRVGAWLGIHRILAAFLLFSLGVIVAGTLSPLRGGGLLQPEAPRACDISRTWLATPLDLVTADDVVINILMFMPFGFALGAIPASWRKVVVILLAVALPFGIEGTQLLVGPLGRGCQSADVVDNLTGLVIGVVAGWPVSWWNPRSRRRSAP
jgi:glycopeptide antibiotics resistance protein